MTKTRPFLEDREWVALAADIKSSRPILTAIEVTDTTMTATDTHALHTVEFTRPSYLRAGIFHAKTGAPIEADRWLDWQRVIPVPSAPIENLPTLDVAAAMPIIVAAIAAYRLDNRYCVTLPTLDDKVAFINPTFLQHAIAGMPSYSATLAFDAPAELKPLTFYPLGIGTRRAVIMPIRLEPWAKSERFSLAEFVAKGTINGARQESVAATEAVL